MSINGDPQLDDYDDPAYWDGIVRCAQAARAKRAGLPAPPPPLRLLTLGEFTQKPNISCYVQGVLPSGAIVVVFGPPKGGKSFSVCDLTMHAAHGLPWQGCKVPKACRVAYLAGEGINGLRVRLHAWLAHHDSVEQAGGFRIMPETLSLPERASEVIELLRAFAPEIVVIDTLNTYFGGGDENATQDMTAFCAAVRVLRDTLGCTVIVIHHTGQADQSRERGSIVLRASADVIIQVAKGENSKDLVGFQVISARDLEEMESAVPLKLVRVATDWLDDNGETISTCVVQSANQPVTLPGRGGRPLGQAQGAVMAVVTEMARAPGTSVIDGEAILMRLDITRAVTERHHLRRSSISSTWEALARRKLLRLIEPGSVGVKLR